MPKKICLYLIKKGKWRKELCENCRINKFKCEIREERFDFEREMNFDAFDERREMSREESGKND